MQETLFIWGETIEEINNMKFVVIGLGSMGKRRIRLIMNNYENIEIVGVDSSIERISEVKKLFNIKTYSDLDTAVIEENPYAALICTSPISHSSIILKCLCMNLNVFTEINLLKTDYDKIINETKEKGLRIFLSSTLLYRMEIQHIQEKVLGSSKKLFYRYHTGQYLPDWHPWESYKDYFVGDKRTNGCREIFAIELPWIIKTFGKLRNITVVKDKISSLALNYNDSYIVLLEHETGHKGVINLDIVSRKAMRSFEAYSEDIHIFWDGTPNSLREYDSITKEMKYIETYSEISKDFRYNENIIENAYLEELDIFIKGLESNRNELVRYTLDDDIYTLSIIDSIEGIKE